MSEQQTSQARAKALAPTLVQTLAPKLAPPLVPTLVSTLASLGLACLMLSTPAIAQDSTVSQTPAASVPAAPAATSSAEQTPSVQTEVQVPAAQSADAQSAVPQAAATTTSPIVTAPTAAVAATTEPTSAAQPTAANPTAANPVPSQNGTALSDATNTLASPDAPTSTAVPAAPADSPAPLSAAGAQAPDTPSAPAADPTVVPFAPSEDSLLPHAIQRMIAPVFASDERDPNLPHDLSPMGMFMAADVVVKAVMIGLVFASVVTWTVLVVKLLELWRASANASAARRRIESAASLPDAVAATGRRNDPSSQMIRAAMAEYERSAPAFGRAGNDGTKDRVGSILSQIEANASRRIGRGTGMLATIGSTAPFVGLFGTVWGIMNSFISISESQTTNLAVVAPGIAEALLATAMGLVAAIPAVVIYNVFARSITGYRLRLANASAGVQRLVSRDLDFRTEI